MIEGKEHMPWFISQTNLKIGCENESEYYIYNDWNEHK